MRVVPRLAQVRQIAHRRFERRDALDFLGRIVRQDRRAPIDARMAEPAFRARDEPDRRARATAARQFADGEAALGGPRQVQVAGRELVRMRQVEERRQQVALLDGAGRGELRDRQDALHGLVAVARGEVDVGERAVRRAEIDADRIARIAHSSTSAGATTRAS